MKKILTILISSIVILVGQPTGNELLNKAENIMDTEYSKAVLIQKIETTSGKMRTLKYRSYSANNGKKILMRYLEPARVRGNALLMKNNSKDIWMYNSRTRRVRKLASHAKRRNFEGSDFTYEDMGGGRKWTDEYTAKNKGEGKVRGTPCFKLVCNPKKNKNPSYSKLIIWLRKSDAYPLKINYYKNGKFLKTLFMQNIQNIEGILTAQKMVMKNHQEGTRTVMKYDKITYNIKLTKRFFSERNLKQ